MLDSVIDVVTRLWAGQLKNCDLIPSRNKIFSSFSELLYKVWGPPSLLFAGCQGFYPWGGGDGRWPGHEVDHSPMSSAEIKNEWQNTYAHSYAFMMFKTTTLFLRNGMKPCGHVCHYL